MSPAHFTDSALEAISTLSSLQRLIIDLPCTYCGNTYPFTRRRNHFQRNTNYARRLCTHRETGTFIQGTWTCQLTAQTNFLQTLANSKLASKLTALQLGIETAQLSHNIRFPKVQVLKLKAPRVRC